MSLEILARFAWEQYAKNKFTFDYVDLEKSNLTRKKINLLFDVRQDTCNKCPSDDLNLVFYFSHFFCKRNKCCSMASSLSETDFEYEVKQFKNFFGKKILIFVRIYDFAKANASNAS